MKFATNGKYGNNVAILIYCSKQNIWNGKDYSMELLHMQR